MMKNIFIDEIKKNIYLHKLRVSLYCIILWEYTLHSVRQKVNVVLKDLKNISIFHKMEKSINQTIETIESFQKRNAHKTFRVYQGGRTYKFKKTNLTEMEFTKLLRHVLNDIIVELNNDDDIYEISGIILKKKKDNQ